MERFWHAFIPLCVAFDGIGLLPLFWGMSQQLRAVQRRRAIAEAVLTAFFVAFGFLLVSRFVFSLMGLELADIMVAGGGILIVLCLRELLLPAKPVRGGSPSPGVVPLGVPLLTGPAVLTTVLLVRDQYGWAVTVAALLANMALVWGLLHGAAVLMRLLGQEGAEAISKIFSVILTAFGVMLIRQGITTYLTP
ncbi:MAG: MarC family protein [Candidatus Omnitrophica bacterium]|nr:MarC family protein [Candidatus Omnitrophota bacterium]